MRMMISTVAALLAATALGMPAHAQGQTSYYARARLSGTTQTPSAPTYVARYSEIYGSCAGGKQSTPIVECKRSDNTTVANSLCSAQVKTKDCTMPPVPSCGALQAGWVRGGSYNETVTVQGSSVEERRVNARAWCSATVGRKASFNGACYLNGTTAGLAEGATLDPDPSNPALSSSMCG